MKFQLKWKNRNVAESELIADLKRVANELQKNSVSMSEYDTRSKFHSVTLANRFGSWSKAVEKAGLSPTSLKKISDEKLLEDLKLVAKKIHKPSLKKDEYNEHGQFGLGIFAKRFGSWNKALDKAGLQITRKLAASEEELFTNLVEIWMKLGRQPKSEDLTSQTSKFHGHTYARRFGSWRKALEAFVVWANKEDGQSFETPVQKEQVVQKPSPTQSRAKPSPKQEAFRHRTSRNINYRLRFLVMRRDNFKCRITGRSPATDPSVILWVDHIKSWDKGGETVIENLQTLAKEINIGKSNLDMYQ